MNWETPNAWRDSYDEWKLASPYDEGGPSYEAVEELQSEMERLIEENEWLAAAGDQLLACGNAIVGADMGDPDAAEAFDMFDAARLSWRQARRVKTTEDKKEDVAF